MFRWSRPSPVQPASSRYIFRVRKPLEKLFRRFLFLARLFQIAMTSISAGRSRMVPPGPVFALFGRRQSAKFPVRPVRFHGPLPVVANLARIPDVIVAVVRIVYAHGGAFRAAHRQHRCKKRHTHNSRSHPTFSRAHVSLLHANFHAGMNLQTLQRSDKLSMISNPREYGKFLHGGIKCGQRLCVCRAPGEQNDLRNSRKNEPLAR